VVYRSGLFAFDYLSADQLRDDAIDLVILVGGFLARAGNDQRRARFVDQNGVHFVNDGVVIFALHAVGDAELHVVAQVIEAEFVVGPVRNIGVVGFLTLVVVQVVNNHAHLHAERPVDAPHPFRIALRQVIVDGDHVDALAGERVQVAGQGSDEGFAFAGLHFGDPALVKHHTAHQLDVEMAHIENPPAGLANYREGLHHQVVKRGALGDFFLEFDGFPGEFGVRQLAYCRFECADGCHHRVQLFDFTFVLGSEDFREDFIDNHEWSQYGGKSANSILPCL